MGDGYNFQQLKAAILALSRATDWEVAKKEWRLFEISEADETETCLCGHFPIIELCTIANATTGKSVGRRQRMREALPRLRVRFDFPLSKARPSRKPTSSLPDSCTKYEASAPKSRWHNLAALVCGRLLMIKKLIKGESANERSKGGLGSRGRSTGACGTCAL